jgi:hypothetical protein
LGIDKSSPTLLFQRRGLEKTTRGDWCIPRQIALSGPSPFGKGGSRGILAIEKPLSGPPFSKEGEGEAGADEIENLALRFFVRPFPPFGKGERRGFLELTNPPQPSFFKGGGWKRRLGVIGVFHIRSLSRGLPPLEKGSEGDFWN